MKTKSQLVLLQQPDSSQIKACVKMNKYHSLIGYVCTASNSTAEESMHACLNIYIQLIEAKDLEAVDINMVKSVLTMALLDKAKLRELIDFMLNQCEKPEWLST